MTDWIGNGTVDSDSAPTALIDLMRDVRGIKVAELSDVDLTALMNGLLGEYARWRPVMAVAVFDTVADQAEYTWTEIGDASGNEIVTCLWNWGAGVLPHDWGTVVDSFALLADLTAEDWHLPSQQLVEQMKWLQYMRGRTGSGYQIEPGGNVTLTPCPSEADISVYVLYTKAYGSLDAIPSCDYDIFCDLVESKCSEVIVKNIAASAMSTLVRTPEYEINAGSQIGFWKSNGKEKLASFYQKCAAGKAAVGRS
jgi:hypothetical protein